jgi:hypothetical protein
VPLFQASIEKKNLFKGGRNADAFIVARASAIGGLGHRASIFAICSKSGAMAKIVLSRPGAYASSGDDRYDVIPSSSSKGAAGLNLFRAHARPTLDIMSNANSSPLPPGSGRKSNVDE